MRRINKKSELPTWFDINRYSVLHELTDNELIDQLIVRRDSRDRDFNFLMSLCDELRSLIANEYQKIFENVIRVLDTSTFHMEKAKRKKYSNLQMTGVGGIDPLRLIDVMHLHKKAEMYISENEISRSLRGQKRAVSKTIVDNDTLMLNIDMTWPDEVLIQDFKTLLPIWRKELDYEVGNDINIISSWGVIKKKILDYKVILLLDLQDWASVFNVNITNRVMAQALFTDGEYDSTNLSQTIKPFIENLLADFSIEKMKRKAMDEP